MHALLGLGELGNSGRISRETLAAKAVRLLPVQAAQKVLDLAVDRGGPEAIHGDLAFAFKSADAVVEAVSQWKHPKPGMLQMAARAVARAPTRTLPSIEDSDMARVLGVLVCRELADKTIADRYLLDPSPQVVLEAARAINDVPIPEAMPALAALLAPRSSRGDEAPSSQSAISQSLLTSAATNWPAALNFTHDEWRTWVLRRAVNAHFRLGDAANAAALADWAKPPGRDKIVGLWRPLPPRNHAPARSALSTAWSGLAADPSTNVLMAALDAGSKLGVPGLAETLRQLAQHPDAGVRATVAKLQDASRSATLAELTAQLERGSVREQQAALTALADRPEVGADTVLVAQMDQLLAAKLPPELALDVLEAATKRMARGRPGGLESPPSREIRSWKGREKSSF